MINTQALRGIIAEHGMSGVSVAKELGIAPKTFYDKMKKGVFGSDEIEIMIRVLDIKDPARIFFAQQVT